MKKILVIGGNGFIGKNLVKQLVEENYNVYSFDVFEPAVRLESVHYIIGDFFDNEMLEKALIDKDVVIHSLSTINPGNSNQRFMQGYSRDFVQSVYLFDQCVKRKIKVIFLSSGGTVYGIQKSQPIKEEFLPNPINHYGSVKLCIESVLRTFNKQSHSKMLIARISNPYGPGQDSKKGVGFIDAALKKTIKKEPIEIWGDGSIVRDYVYIDDVCKMLLSLIDYEGDCDVFNLSSGEGISLNDIIHELNKMGLNPTVVYKDSRSVDVEKVILDNHKIKSICPINITKLDYGIKKYYQLLLELEKNGGI